MKNLFGSVAVSMALVCSPAFAQSSGFYAGGAIGQTSAKDACNGLPVGVSCDDKDTGYKVFGGYQATVNFGVEIGYVDLGKVTLSVPGLSANVKSDGFEFLAVGTIPLVDKLSAYGKLGAFAWDAKASVLGVSVKENGTDLTIGLGFKYDFTKSIAGRVEWQRYNDIGNNATIGVSDVDLYSVGVVFKF